MPETVRIAALALVLAAAFTLPAAAQSFDCAKASAPDEKAVCASGELSALDDEMSALYDDIMSHAMMGVSGETRDGQEAFLDSRAACGAADACLETAYKSRIAELTRIKKDIGQGGAN